MLPTLAPSGIVTARSSGGRPRTIACGLPRSNLASAMPVGAHRGRGQQAAKGDLLARAAARGREVDEEIRLHPVAEVVDALELRAGHHQVAGDPQRPRRGRAPVHAGQRHRRRRIVERPDQEILRLRLGCVRGVSGERERALLPEEQVADVASRQQLSARHRAGIAAVAARAGATPATDIPHCRSGRRRRSADAAELVTRHLHVHDPTARSNRCPSALRGPGGPGERRQPCGRSTMRYTNRNPDQTSSIACRRPARSVAIPGLSATGFLRATAIPELRRQARDWSRPSPVRATPTSPNAPAQELLGNGYLKPQ